jgi:hypothetical protein
MMPMFILYRSKFKGMDYPPASFGVLRWHLAQIASYTNTVCVFAVNGFYNELFTSAEEIHERAWKIKE